MGEITSNINKGGGAKLIEKHVSKGKLFVRDRVDLLLDPGTPFLELSQMAAYKMYDDVINAAGIVTGIGMVKGYVNLFHLACDVTSNTLILCQ